MHTVVALGQTGGVTRYLSHGDSEVQQLLCRRSEGMGLNGWRNRLEPLVESEFRVVRKQRSGLRRMGRVCWLRAALDPDDAEA